MLTYFAFRLPQYGENYEKIFGKKQRASESVPADKSGVEERASKS